MTEPRIEITYKFTVDAKDFLRAFYAAVDAGERDYIKYRDPSVERPVFCSGNVYIWGDNDPDYAGYVLDATCMRATRSHTWLDEIKKEAENKVDLDEFDDTPREPAMPLDQYLD